MSSTKKTNPVTRLTLYLGYGEPGKALLLRIKALSQSKAGRIQLVFYSSSINRDPWTRLPRRGRSKAAFVADVLNKTLYTLITSCSKSDGVRNYFDVGVIAYAGSQVTSGFGGALSGDIVHPIQAISENTLRVEERKKKVDDGAGGIIELTTKFPVWFDPKSEGGTPMRAALGKTIETVGGWCEQHRGSYPPTILHVTDGQSYRWRARGNG